MPVRLKFSGIYNKYVEGLRKREVPIQLREEQMGKGTGGRPFDQLSHAD